LSIEENIETIVATFQKGRELAESGISIDALINELNKFEIRYRSVAFEGASMGVALTSDFETWKAYAKASEKHATQVHIGLGWAIAEKQLDLTSTLSLAEAEMRVKALDGFGYWNGLFQRRATIRTQQIPENITPEFQVGFDQGVGRGIWYITKGEVDKVLNIINHFAEERRANLWQGIGVALTYVGGCSDELMAELKTASGEFKMNLEKGIEAAEGSMRKAGL
jgi:enediyne biosynthesis protein E3